ncbi:DegT/DnrJ/EryC1/StrS family aminotransferase [Actinoallomurus spadix]|uniref:DegT/DnrJ/EryC1/StrS aminotransferase family protein n=1 Tax=Actinoallomurus spadix TaxID=79912 RepID=A0ABN0X2X0_9ACTN|nr:DegT/DnrJ/EryC1/StrS family aminotransferase [Actinoallomurus spadix]MCO5989465.1 DegT/DnrJ/EryC1/StrS family aminotransferase [Actinoallomurus spadix]
MSDPLMSVYPPLEPATLVTRRSLQFPFNSDGLTLTHLGRGAIWLALKALGLGPGHRLAMPAYHCGSEVEAARLAGIEVVFYRVLPTLEVDHEDLFRVSRQCHATYLISYYGFPMPPLPPGTLVIEDAAHALFSYDGGAAIGSRGAAAIFCPRKSLGVPDGGAVLIRDGHIEAQGRPPWKRMARSMASQSMGWAAQSRAGVLRAPATKVFRKVSKAEQAVEEGTLTEVVIGEWNLEVADLEVAASKSSRMTEWAVHGADGEAIRRHRRRNYAILLNALPDVVPPRFRGLPDGVAPLYYPVRVPQRDRTIAELQKRGVRSIEIWPVPHPLLDRRRFAELEPLRHEMLALPVHQGLSEWHMEQVAKAAREAIMAAHR